MATTYDSKADLDAVRALLEDLASKGRVSEAIGLALDLVARVRDDNTALYVRLMQALRARYGRSSE